MDTLGIVSIIAIFTGPIIAVQIEKLLERNRDAKRRKKTIFKTLMSTRGTVLSYSHVEALNRIDLEFSGKNKYKKVIEAWKENFDNLCQTPTDEQLSVWISKCEELLANLLYEMGNALGYDFDKTLIKRNIYSPAGHHNVEHEQQEVRLGVIDLLKGNSSLPMYVVQNEEQINKLYPMVSYLIQLVKEFSLSFDQLKRERSLMDFNDLEHYAIKILENRGVREFLQNKFRYIFVDEYQDSNMVQETIIKQVSRGNNLFLVGDVKQSIYRFRLAEPSLFIEKYTSFEKFEVNKELKKDSVRIDLSKNFRSRGEILSGINYLFDNLMSRELGEIEYDSSARLYKGLDFEEIDGPELELNIIEKKTDDLDIDQEIEDMGQAEVEARLITEKIKGLIGQKYYNAKKSRYQEITYRDVVILMRSPGTRVETYQEVFSETGIPLFLDDDSGFFDTLEIKIFLNLLRLIDNRRQDIPLLSVLRSPIVNLTADQLADIRIKCPEGSFYDAAFSYIGDNSQNLADKISNDNNCILNNEELNIK
ncbi:MAG: DUF6680 family protein [archaeon]